MTARRGSIESSREAHVTDAEGDGDVGVAIPEVAPHEAASTRGRLVEAN